MAYITLALNTTALGMDDSCYRCGMEHDDRGIWRTLPLSGVNIYVCANCYVWMMGILVGGVRSGELKWSPRRVLVPNAR